MAAAVVTTVYIVLRLTQASGPVETALRVVSSAPQAMVVEALSIDGQAVLTGPWATGNNAPGHAVESAPQARPSVGVRVGRPALVEASLSAPRASTLSCTPEPRPHGSCELNITLESVSQMRCEFECKTQALKPDATQGDAKAP